MGPKGNSEGASEIVGSSRRGNRPDVATNLRCCERAPASSGALFPNPVYAWIWKVFFSENATTGERRTKVICSALLGAFLPQGIETRLAVAQ